MELFSHTDSFWRLCSRNEKFLLLQQRCQLYSIIELSLIKICHSSLLLICLRMPHQEKQEDPKLIAKQGFLDSLSQRLKVIFFWSLFCLSSVCQSIHVNPFPHTTILQQTTLNVFCQNIKNLHKWMDNLWQKVENIVAKGGYPFNYRDYSLFFDKICSKSSAAELSYKGKG